MLILFVALPAAARAQSTVYWNGTSTWADPAAWSGDAAGTTPGAVPTAADTAFFSATPVTTAPTVGLLADRSLAGLSFAGTATGTTSFTGGGSDVVLTLGPGGISLASTIGSAVTIGSATPNQDVSLAVGADQTWTNDSAARLLSILGGVSRVASDTTSRTLTVGGAGSTLISGGIVDGGTSGSLGLTKTGAGTLTLGSANTFSGPLALNAGYVAAASNSALGGGSSQIVFGSGGGLQATGSFSLSRTVQLVAGTANLAVTPGNTLTLAGPLTNTGATTQVNKLGYGTLNLTQAGPSGWSGSLNSSTAPTTLTGGLLVTAGSVRISNAAALGAASNIIAVGSAQGAGIDLPGGITLPNTVVLNLSAESFGDGYFNGNGQGQLTSTSGTNTVTGLVNIGRSNGSLGAAAGATLNITGGVQGNGQRLAMVGPGTINISGGAITNVFGVQRINSGTTTITVPITFGSGSHNGLRAQGGGATLVLAGPAFVNANTRENSQRGGGTLRLDNSAEAVSTRTGGTSALRLVDATLNLVANGSSPVVERMAALQAAGGYSSIVVNTTGQTAAVQFDSLTQATANTLFLRTAGTGANVGSPSNQIVFRTTLPTLSPTPLGQGILARAIVEDGNGVNFATYSNGSIRAFTGYDTVNLNAVSLPTTSATSTVQVGSSVTLSGNRTVNAVKLTGGGLALNGTGSTLTLTSGGLLATGGTSSIAAGLAVTSGATALGLTVADGSRVNVAAPLYSTAPITIGGGGTVEISAPIYTGDQYSINGGVTRLAAGGSLYPGQGTPTGSVQNLTVSYGAILDLNGNSTLVGRFWGPDSPDYQNAAGEVTSATPAVFATRVRNQSYTPVRISGGLSVLNGGGSLQWYTTESTYTGATALLGGTTTLKDGARLTATSAVSINYGGWLRFWNSDGQFALSDRVNDAAPITFRGGYLEFVGRRNTDVTETLGATTLAEGLSDIYIDRLNTTLPGSAVLTLASLTSTGGGVNFRAQSTTTGALGLPGDNPRLIITANEAGPGAGLTNNLLGAWAVVEGTDFASYVPGRGVGAVNQVGFPGYNGTTLPATSAATQNIKLAADGTVPAGGLDLNSLVFSNNLAFTNAADTLNLTSGGLLRSSTATNYTVGATANSGRLTAGGAGATGTQKLVISHNGTGTATTTINAQIVDNGSAPVQLVANLVNTGTLTLAGGNTYTGGTVVSGRNSSGTVTIASGGVIPAGGLTINGGTVSQSTGGVIDSTNAVTINGAGTLTLTGSNTLASLAFNNTGTQNNTTNNPTVNAGTLTLSSAMPITAGGMNPAGLATINGTLDFGNAAKTITVSPLQFDGMAFAPFSPALNIAGVVQNSGKITVNGGGLLQVSGASTFSGGYSVASGSGLYINANSTGAVTNGPLGTGPLELASGARLLSGGGFTVANAVSLAGGLAFEGVTSLTMSGGVALPAAGTATIDIPAPQPTLTLSGVLAGTGSALVKNGYGTLLLSGANTFDGGVTVNRGTVTVGNAAALGTGTLTMNGGGLNASAAGLTLANAQSWGGGFTFGGTNSLTLSGGVNLAQDSTVGVSAGTLTVSGAIGDSGANRGLTKSGAGTLALTGTNTYGGVTTVNAGVLSIAGTASLPGWNTAGRVAVIDGGTIAVPNTVGDADVATMLGTGNFTAGGAIGFDTSAGDRAWAAALAAAVGVTKLGTNTLTVSAASTHTGPTTVLAGTLRLADQLAAQNSILTVQSGATVQWDAGVAANAFTVGGLSGAGTATLTNTGSAGISLTIGGSNATTAFSGTLGGAGSLVKQGTGTQTLSGTGITYTGSTTVNAGTLILDGANTYAASSTAVASGATLVVANSASQTIANPITGAGSLVKQAAATLTLSGANTFTGGTTIEQGTVVLSGTLSATSPITILATGTLQLGASNRWGDATTTSSAPITVGPAGTVQSNGFFNTLVDPRLDGGTLSLTGGSAGVGAYGLKGTVTVSQPSTINSPSGSNNWIAIGPTDVDGTLALNVARMTSGTNPDLTVTSELRNPAGRINSLTKSGTGIMLFNNQALHTGGTTINAGTLQLQGTLPTTGTITINDGATFQMMANDRWGNALTTATAPVVVNTGGVVLSNNTYNTFIDLTLGGGTLRATGGFDPTWQAFGLKGTVTVSGSSASTIDAGTTGNGNNGINIGPTPNQGAGGFLTFAVADATSSAAADLVVGVPLRNNFSTATSFNANGITKTGAGTMQLTAVNTFTGGVNVNQGVLEVGGAGQLNAGTYAAAIAAAGTFRMASSANQTLSGVISGAGRLEKAGSGTLTLTGSNTFGGTATVDAGTLVVNSTLPSGLSVAAAGWLAGTGSVGGTTTVAGRLSPGNSPGVMTFDTLSLASSSTTLVELLATGTRGTDYDGITVTAANGMTYGGGLAFSFGGTILPDDTTFDVFALTGTPSGSFTNVTSTGFYTGTWTGADGVFSLTQGQQQLTFTQSTGDVSIAYVPEPGTLLGAAVCIAALLLVRRQALCR